jgi:predicted nuclease with TOPRIM domain
MIPIIATAGAILAQSVELFKIPAVKESVQGLFGFLKKAFTNNKRAQERIEILEKLDASQESIKKGEEAIVGLQASLDDLLYDNEELKKQLEEEVKKVETKMQEAGININKKNTFNITGNDNIGAQDITNSNITINKH